MTGTDARTSLNSGQIRRDKLQPGTVIHGRNPIPIKTGEHERQPAEAMAAAFAQLQRDLRALVKMGQDVTKPVDEYQAHTLLPESELSLTLTPNWEYSEKIESVVINGPAGAVTLQLGDRLWTVTIPASGILVIAPIGLLIGRNDPRILTAATPGDYSLELMGHADVRWSS